MDELCKCLECSTRFDMPTSGGGCPSCGGSKWTDPSYSSLGDMQGGRDKMQSRMQNKTFSFGQQRQQQAQQPQNQPLNVTGFITNAEEREGGRNGTFWKLTINGRTFNAFEVNLDGIEIGSYVQGSYYESENPRGGAPMKTLTSLQAMEPPAGSAPPQQRGEQGEDPKEMYWQNRAAMEAEKNLHILREASWNIANALIRNAIELGCVQKPDNAGDLFKMTILAAHDVEKDVSRAPEFDTPKPSANNTGAVQIDDIPQK